MICPVYTQNAVGRYVYLPEPMTMVRMKSADEYELEKYEAGHYFVEIPAQEIVFFIRTDTEYHCTRAQSTLRQCLRMNVSGLESRL